ncbi:hypothetical protein ACFLTM_03860 [Candidatus Bipolaricaulota bacterium]
MSHGTRDIGRSPRFSQRSSLLSGLLWMVLWLGGMFVFHFLMEGTTSGAITKLGLADWRLALPVYTSFAVLAGVGFELIRVMTRRSQLQRLDREPREKLHHI